MKNIMGNVAGGGGKSARLLTTFLATMAAMGAVSAAPQPLAMPGDPDWGKTDKCNLNSDFVEPSDSVPMLAALKSRHTMCIQGRANTQDVLMNMMSTLDGQSWEVYKAPATGRTVATCLVGRVQWQTQYQIFGKASTLDFKVAMRARALNVQLNQGLKPGAPGSLGGVVCPGTSYAVEMIPEFPDSPAIGTSKGQPYGLKLSGNPLTMKINNLWTGATTGTFDTNTWSYSVSWSATDTSGSHLRFQFAPLTYRYRVNGADDYNGVQFKIYSVLGAVPDLRCDKNLATATSSGCVFPDAAPVLVVERNTYPDAAQHIREAIAGTSVGMTGPAPGGFQLAPGMAAVGVNAPGSVPMRRVKSKALQKLSRDATCNLESSMINTRLPKNVSSQCQAFACSCDEYPFAASDSGGHWNPGGTSAKMIVATENSAVGSKLSNMFTTERVLDIDDDLDYFWVYVK